MSSVTSMLAVPTAPLPETALAVTMFGPSANGKRDAEATVHSQRPGIELMVTVAVGSSTVPLTVVGLMFR